MQTKEINHWNKLKNYKLSDKIYMAGFSVIVLSFITAIASMLILGGDHTKEITGFFIKPAIYIFTLAAALEYWGVIEKLFKKKLFQWGIGVLAVLVYKYSEAYTDKFINNFVGNEPSYFPSAKSILTALYLPYSWLILVSAFISIFVLFNWILIPVEIKGRSSFAICRILARFFGLMWVIIYATQAKVFFEDKDSLFSSIAKEVIVQSEFYEKTHCANVEEYELSAYLDRGYISIYNPRNESFRTESCEIEAVRK